MKKYSNKNSMFDIYYIKTEKPANVPNMEKAKYAEK
jgi:hypothetical protein